MDKSEMEIGKRYKGYALLNEYGQFEFTPCQKMPSEGGMKIVRSGSDYTLYESRYQFRLSFTFQKGQNPIESVKSFLASVQNCIVVLYKYLK